MNDSITIIREYFQYFLYYGIRLIFHFFFFFKAELKKMAKGGKRYLIYLFATILRFFFNKTSKD